MTIKELKNLCTKNYPDNCKECPMYKNDCENYEKGHKWQDIDDEQVTNNLYESMKEFLKNHTIVELLEVLKDVIQLEKIRE